MSAPVPLAVESPAGSVGPLRDASADPVSFLHPAKEH